MEFHYPNTIEEAILVLKRPSAVAIAGGTSFVLKPKAKHLVDLTKLPLNYILENEEDILIGATTTVTDLIQSQVVGSLASGLLMSACSQVADTQLRNVITVGGNIACGFNWASLPPALMVLDATLRFAGSTAKKMSLEEYYGSSTPSRDIISEVVIPKKTNSGKGKFVKFSRTETDHPAVSLAVYFEREKGGTKVRIAVSGITRPTRMKSIENQLDGKKVTEEYLQTVITSAVSQLSVAESYVFSQAYRRTLLITLLRRALLDLSARVE